MAYRDCRGASAPIESPVSAKDLSADGRTAANMGRLDHGRAQRARAALEG